MSAKRITRSDVKKHCVRFTILTAISLCIALSDDEAVRIIFSVLTLFLGFMTYHSWRHLALPEEKFAQEMEKLQSSKSSSKPCSSNSTTEFNLYHSPDAVFSPHNDN